MMPTEPTTDPAPDAIRPLKEVWLRPRRVFRALAEQPLSFTDYALASILGIGNLLALHRSQPGDVHTGVGGILLNSLIFGPLVGIASTFLFTSIYTRLGARAGGNSSRAAVFHVLAYGGIPVVAGLVVWGLAILLIGDAAYLAAPAKEVDGFQSFILGLEVLAYVFFLLWSVVLQVMGFSELQGVATGKAFGIWLLGQLLWIVALASLVLIAAILFPGLMPAAGS
jgi:Yip1 domain